MTFSICARETYADDAGDEQYRFGVAVTTRLPGVGVPCPHVNGHGAVATQSLTNVELGRRGVEYLADGLGVEDALRGLLNADDGSADRQLHGVSREGSFTFSGADCHDWFGHAAGENYTVAGNLLVGESVVDRTADAYEDDRDGDAPLAKRLVDALGAGQAAGGDKRDDLTVQSAAVRVVDTGVDDQPAYDDLRVDASEDPIVDLRETYRLAKRGHEDALEKYGETDDGNGVGSDGEDGVGGDDGDGHDADDATAATGGAAEDAAENGE